MRIIDCSSDVCSSDLTPPPPSTLAPRATRSSPPSPSRQPHSSIPSIIPRPASSSPNSDRSTSSTAPRSTQPPSSSEELRVGYEWVSTVRSRWAPYHSNTHKNLNYSTRQQKKSN